MVEQNTDEKILSIVIPSYNTGQFLDKNIITMLDSRINNKLEILIVNDGSSDDTAERATKYQKLYPGTVKLINKENGGHGSVINKGIEIASGRYFKVIDGDDWVVKENLVSLIADLENIDSDIVLNPYHFIFEGGGTKNKIVDFKAPEYGKEYRFADICHYYQKLPIHAITYKTSILRDNNIRMREHCFYEDNEYDFLPVPFLSTITILKYPVYQYLVAQKNQSISDSNVLKNHQMFFSVIQDCIQCFEKYQKQVDNSVNQYMLDTLLELIRSQYNIYLRCGFKKGSYQKFIETNRRFKEKYSRYYKKVAIRYQYIGILQSENFLVFSILSFLMKVYKKTGNL